MSATSGGDWHLEAMLSMMERGYFTADLTLLVQGTLVAGTPISQREYLEFFGAVLTESARRAGLAGTDAIRERFDELGRRVEERERRPDVAGANGSLPGGRGVSPFVCLKDVVIAAGSGLVAVPMWRGRLDQVGGWSLGRQLPAPQEN